MILMLSKHIIQLEIRLSYKYSNPITSKFLIVNSSVSVNSSLSKVSHFPVLPCKKFSSIVSPKQVLRLMCKLPST